MLCGHRNECSEKGGSDVLSGGWRGTILDIVTSTAILGRSGLAMMAAMWMAAVDSGPLNQVVRKDEFCLENQ